jgi:nitrate/TMAO reductase-like tetraheme cytochrome c subunit
LSLISDLNYGGTYRVKVADRLYQGQYMTCATCHDVHNRMNQDDPAAAANYLVLAPQKDSALCLTCHIK